MQSKEAIVPPGSNLRSLRRVSGIRSLQSPARITQRDCTILDPPAMPTALRTPSPRLSQGSMVLDFASRMLQAAAASPTIPHPLQVAHQTQSPKPQSAQPAPTQSKVDIARKLSTIRRRRSRSSGYHRAGVPGESGLAEKLVPIRRHTRRVRKPSQHSRKAQRTLRSHTKTLLHRMTDGIGKPVAQKCLPTSLVDCIDKVPENDDLEIVRSSVIINDAPACRAEIRASWAPEGKIDPLRSTPQEPDSQEAILLQRAQEDSHGLRMETIRLQEECARIEARCKRDITRMAARHEVEIYRYQEENLRLREAQEMDMVSMGIRADFFEGGYKDQIKQLEATLVEERNKSSYHLAHHQHYKMMYNMERQARLSAVSSPVTTPVVPTEDNLWGALRDIQATLHHISSQVEARESKEHTEQEPEPNAPVTVVSMPVSAQTDPPKDDIGVAQEEHQTSPHQEHKPIETPKLQQKPGSRSHSPTVAAAPCRSDIISSSPVEADEPSIEPRISDILTPASTEKNGNELRLLALRQLLPRICTSQSQSPSIVAGNTGSGWPTGITSSTSELPVDVPCTSAEPDLETGCTSSSDDTVSNVKDKEVNEDDEDDEDENEEETDPDQLLNFSISISTIPFSPLTYPPSISSSTPSPTSPILSTSIRRISVMPAIQRSRAFSFASSLSGNGNDGDDNDGNGHCGAKVHHDGQAGKDWEEEGGEGVKDVAKLLLEAWEWDSMPSLDLVDFSAAYS
ncbi:hypothetical protein DL98DRAFT_532156 [Cadophora sp. DSE1049]|nr:hypothetical protein DL98DRAFT_532156 [Cadophora sp. DSE1049]